MIKHAIYVAIACCLAAVFLAQSSYAYDPIIRPYDSIRSYAMGGVHTVTGIYDQNFFGNPARVTANPVWKVQLPDITAELSTASISEISKLTSGGDVIQNIAGTAGKNNHLRLQTSFPGVYFPNAFGGKWSYAFALLTSTLGDVALLNTYNVNLKAIVDIAPSFTVGRKLLKNDALSVGATAHLNYRLANSNFDIFKFLSGEGFSISQDGLEGSEYDMDLGATYILPFKPKGITITTGASINNVFGGKYTNLGLDLIKDATGQAPGQPRTLNMGVSVSKEQSGFLRHTSIALELNDLGNNSGGSIFRLIHLGAETHFGLLYPRLGINQGYLCGGLGIDLSVFTIDVATYGEELGLNAGDRQDRRVALRLGFQI
jgi:hypothetical protein